MTKAALPLKVTSCTSINAKLLLAEDEVKHDIWGATLNDLFYIWQHEFTLEIWVTLLEKQNTAEISTHCLLPLTIHSTHCSCEHDIWALSRKALPAILFSISVSWEHAVLTHYIASCVNQSRLRPESTCSFLVWARVFNAVFYLASFLF